MSEKIFDPRKTFGAAVTEIANTQEDIVVVSADSGKSSGFGQFMVDHPDRYFECGIAEQAATGMASGLAAMGKTPIFCAIAPFITCRNYEQMRNDIGYMRQNVKLVGRNGGFTYSDLGSTHHSLEDYALMRMIPGMTVLAPQDASEIREAVAAMIEHEGPVYMRIGASGVPNLFEEGTFEIGKGRHVLTGGDVTVISTGYVTPEVMKAVNGLVADGVSVDLICLGTVVPLDTELILGSVRRTKLVVTIEEHYDRGGLGGAVSELVACDRDAAGAHLEIIGVSHGYAPTGPYADLVKSYGLDADSIRSKIQKLVSSR